MMLAIGIRYLSGWVMAAHPADRESPEWPPHPDRVFMALAAAHFECDGGAEERAALEWLEEQGPPMVVASGACERRTVTTFVPVNDSASPIKKDKPLMPAGSLAIGRDRQPRQFPVAVPDDATVCFRWQGAEPSESQRQALSELAAKVAAVGHSASLVQMWVEGDPGRLPEDGATRRTHRPIEGSAGGKRLRVFGPGRLRQLEQRFASGQRPLSSLWSGYTAEEPGPATPEVSTSHFASNLIVLRQVEGRQFGLESTLLLTKALRDTAMSKCPIQPPPEWLSGHRPNGAASERELGHLAFLPLPHVGRQHADGHLLGMALAVPRDVGADEIATCLGSWLLNEAGWPNGVTLRFLGREHLGPCELKLDESEVYRQALSPATWCGPSRRWATVTPISFDRHAKSKEPHAEIEAFIADGCERIGLPRPSDVIVTPVPMFLGAPHAREMPRIVRKSDGGKNRQTHAILTFDRDVQGPVLIGAGRYRGYGLCRPLRGEEGET
jgi:CRISPR-associated protein Csb2